MKFDGRTLLKKGNGWELRFYYNKIRYYAYGTTQKKCIEKYKALKKDAETQKPIIAKPILVHEYILQWFKVYKSKDVENNERCIRLHIFGNLPNKPIKELTSIDIQTMLNNIKSKRQAQYSYQIMGQVVRYAINDDLITKNIMLNVKKPTHVTKLGTALSAKEQCLFLDKIVGNEYENIFKFYLYTGVRRSEALHIKWEDIDYENELIAVHGTKTAGSERVIPLFASVKQLLATMEQYEDKYIFAFLEQSITRKFKEIMPNHKLHDLRHTFAYNANKAGISLKFIQVWLGHSKIDTTANIYLNTRDFDSEKELAKKL